MKATLKNIAIVANEVNNIKTRSAWAKGVKVYAEMHLENFAYFCSYDEDVEFNEETILNGAYSWRHWSESGFGFCYNQQIAETLCTPTELKLTKNGMKEPNKRESWIDVQARAAYQGWIMIKQAINAAERKQAAKLSATKVVFEDYTEQEEQARKTA